MRTILFIYSMHIYYNKSIKKSYICKGLTNAMERLHLTSKDIYNITKYYNLATKKVQLDINKLLKKDKLTSKQFKRLKTYSFRYKMIIQHISDNTDARLNKLYRKPLTVPNNDFD